MVTVYWSIALKRRNINKDEVTSSRFAGRSKWTVRGHPKSVWQNIHRGPFPKQCSQLLPTGGEWPLCATCQLSANGRSLLQVNGLSLATVSKRHTNVPWPCHNGCAGNLPSLMMPVWPRLKEAGSRNPKEAHSCSDPPLPISPHTSLSLCAPAPTFL